VKIEHITVGPFQENCYLVTDEARGEAALVDPGDEPQRVVDMVERSPATLNGIWLTHAHIDHIGALAAVKRRWDVPVHMHRADEPIFLDAARVAAMYGLPFEQPPLPDVWWEDGDRVGVGEVSFEVQHMPGHSPGLCILVGEGAALAGDLLFAGSIGRTDLPLSDGRAMQRSLERVLQLDDATEIHPGHGPATTMREERATNPFLNGVARVSVR
jgi:hydroxyacylglutathione hydrolase